MPPTSGSRWPRLTALAFLAVSVLVHLGLLQASRSQIEQPSAPKIVRVRVLESEPAPPAAVPAAAPQPPAAKTPAAKTKPARAKAAAKKSAPHQSMKPALRASAEASDATAARDAPGTRLAAVAPVVKGPPERSLSLPEFDDSLDVAEALDRSAEPGAELGGASAEASAPGAASAPAPPLGSEAASASPAVPQATRPATQTGSTQPALATADSSSAAALPGVVEVPTISGRAQYRVHYGDPDNGNVVAMLEESFELGSGQYRLRSEGHAKGLISFFYRGALVQESAGIVSSSGLQPTLYREKRGDRPARQSSIDVARGVVVFPSGAQEPTPPGVQDRLSIFVQLALLRASFPERFGVGETIRLPVLASSHVDSSTWQVIASEPVSTEAGEVPAVRLRRAPTDDEDPTVDLWLALDSRILPVRMRATEPNGRALDQVLVDRQER